MLTKLSKFKSNKKNKKNKISKLLRIYSKIPIKDRIGALPQELQKEIYSFIPKIINTDASLIIPNGIKIPKRTYNIMDNATHYKISNTDGTLLKVKFFFGWPLTNRNLVKTEYPQRIFLGKSRYNQLTEFTGGFGIISHPEQTGNTVLLDLNHRYYYYGPSSQFYFQSLSKIIYYSSDILNNHGFEDIVQPFAIDIQNNVYLLQNSEEFPDLPVILLNGYFNGMIIDNYFDPYGDFRGVGRKVGLVIRL